MSQLFIKILKSKRTKVSKMTNLKQPWHFLHFMLAASCDVTNFYRKLETLRNQGKWRKDILFDMD